MTRPRREGRLAPLRLRDFNCIVSDRRGLHNVGLTPPDRATHDEESLNENAAVMLDENATSLQEGEK